MSNLPQQVNNRKARHVALEIYQQLSVVPTSLVKYQSQGKLLIIGDQTAIEFTELLDKKLDSTVLLTKGSVSSKQKSIALADRTVHIEGYLGAFKITITEPDSEQTDETLNFDIILDLNAKALLDCAMLPNGYFHCDTDKESLEQMADQLVDMVGTFEKPIFIDYDAAICAHSRSGKIACTKCLDACPAQAISAIAEAVSVDTYLCQGGGVCATVCPTAGSVVEQLV